MVVINFPNKDEKGVEKVEKIPDELFREMVTIVFAHLRENGHTDFKDLVQLLKNLYPNNPELVFPKATAMGLTKYSKARKEEREEHAKTQNARIAVEFWFGNHPEDIRADRDVATDINTQLKPETTYYHIINAVKEIRPRIREEIRVKRFEMCLELAKKVVNSKTIKLTPTELTKLAIEEGGDLSFNLSFKMMNAAVYKVIDEWSMCEKKRLLGQLPNALKDRVKKPGSSARRGRVVKN